MGKSEPAPAATPPELETLRAALSQARSVAAYRRALCLWMRVVLGLNVDLIVSVLRCSNRAVVNLERAYRRDGAAILESAGRGGRRHQVLMNAQEYAVLRRLRQQVWPSSTISFQAIHEAVEKEAGRRVKPSTVQQILYRHGWGRAATALVPQHSVPPGLSDAALAAENPHGDGVWYLRAEDPESWFESIREARGK